MRISLNLASRPYSDLGPAVRRLRNALAVLALVCLALGFGLRLLHRKAEAARSQGRALDSEIARLSAERAGYQKTMAEPANAQLLVQSAALNQLFEVKSFSWTLAMEALETVLPAGVQVSSIEPIRDKTGQIELHLRVAGPRDRADELVANLEHSRRFFKPRISGENSEASSGANQRLEPVSASNRFSFDLVAEYNPPTPEEARQASAEAKAKAAAPAHPAPQKARTPGPQGRSVLPTAGLARPAAAAQPSAANSNGFAPQQQPAAASPAPAARQTRTAGPPFRRSTGAGASPMTGMPPRTTTAPAPNQPAAAPASQGGAK